MKKEFKLNEGYGIVINKHLEKYILFVSGRQISEHCAITYNHLEGVYSITCIGTGMSISTERYRSLNSAMGSKTYFCEVKQFERDIEKEYMKRKLIIAKMFYEKLLKQKKFVEDFI